MRKERGLRSVHVASVTVLSAALAAGACADDDEQPIEVAPSGTAGTAGTGGNAGGAGGTAAAGTGGTAGSGGTGGTAGTGGAAGTGGTAGTAATGGTGGTAGSGGTGGTAATGGTGGTAATGGTGGTAGTGGAAGSGGSGGGSTTTCLPGEYYNYEAKDCTTCPEPDEVVLHIGWAEFKVATSSYDPVTQRIELDATGLVQLSGGTYELEYYYEDANLGYEVAAFLTGDVTIDEGVVVIDLSQTAPQEPATRIVVTKFSLDNVCDEQRPYDPWNNWPDQDFVTASPTGGNTGTEWVVGCVFEGNI